jgi:hypothetical protein
MIKNAARRTIQTACAILRCFQLAAATRCHLCATIQIGKQKHTEADYKIGWLEHWTERILGPDIYHDPQNGLHGYAARGHDLPQCYKDSSRDEWVVRISVDDYVWITTPENSQRPVFADLNKGNALANLTLPCLNSIPSGSSRRIDEKEVEFENSVPQGRVTIVSCAIQVRHRIEGNILYVPPYHKAKLVDEPGYDNVTLQRTPGGSAVRVPRNDFFVDVWDYSESK